MKESNKYFFKYARSKLKFKAPIGPLTNKEGNIIIERECVTLNQQYQSVFGISELDRDITIEYLYSEEDLPPIEERMEIVKFKIAEKRYSS